MQPFRSVTGYAAPLALANVDTDKILPAAFMKTVSRAGLKKGLFYALRFDAAGQEQPDFTLNKAPWRDASILITLDNFGCGSSREHAPWALLDFGFRCIIAVSFADIFYGNCFKNGILPICLPRATIERLIADAADPDRAMMTVDLETCTINWPGGTLSFEIDAQRRERLLGGIDDIGVSLRFEDAIASYENSLRGSAPWLADPHLERTG
jgi:3-isopropylmalate/(R)-2-methylmalate dehydratase small subunit